MIVSAFASGERPKVLEWLGLIFALGGLIYLVFPGLSSPPLFSSALMGLAGIAWGFYTLRGRGTTNPLADTTGNFLRTVPMIVLTALPFISQIYSSQKGITLAVLSGAIASGIGYSVLVSRAEISHGDAGGGFAASRSPLWRHSAAVIFSGGNVSIRLILHRFILGGITIRLRGAIWKNKV